MAISSGGIPAPGVRERRGLGVGVGVVVAVAPGVRVAGKLSPGRLALAKISGQYRP